jgi:hypothetical protein
VVTQLVSQILLIFTFLHIQTILQNQVHSSKTDFVLILAQVQAHLKLLQARVIIYNNRLNILHKI